MQWDILATILLTATIQSLFGVGVLLFGTPILLVLGYDFITALTILLPISLTINLLQVSKDYRHVQVPFYRQVLTLSIPCVVLCLLLVTTLKLNIGSIVGLFLIVAALKSIQYVRDNGGMLILMSHLGRPKNPDKAESEEEKAKIIKANQKLRMDFVADKLRELVGGNVTKVDAIVGPEVKQAVDAMKPGDIILLDNTRCHAGETKNDGTKTTARPRIPATPIPVKLP